MRLNECTDITRTVGQFGGSYHIEYLAKKLAQKVKEKMEAVKEIGGSVKAIEGIYVAGYTRLFSRLSTRESALANSPR